MVSYFLGGNIMILDTNRVVFTQYVNDCIKAINDVYINFYTCYHLHSIFELQSCTKWALIEAKEYVKEHNKLSIIDALEELRKRFDAMSLSGKPKSYMYATAYDQITWLLDAVIEKGW